MTREHGPCDFCGEPYELGVLEVYPEQRTFTLVACCEAAHEDAAAWLAEDLSSEWAPVRRDVVAWFERETGLRIRGIWPSEEGAFQYENGGLTVDWGLRLGPVDLATAKAFVRKHHRHNKPPCSWRWGHGAYNGDELIAVAMVGRPVARMLDATKILPKLSWNACSMLYAAVVREARRRVHEEGAAYERVITYTLGSESGTSVQAAGFTFDGWTKGGSWDRRSRRRQDKADTGRKRRWARQVA